MDPKDLAQFKTEGQPAFPVENKENDNSAASPAGEQTPSDQTPSAGGDKKPDGQQNGTDGRGFADDPRWQERENDWKTRFNQQEERHVQEMTKLREDVESRFAGNAPKTQSPANAPADIPDWFNGDETQWSKFRSWNEGLLKQAEDNAFKRLQSQQSEEQKKIDDATQYMNSEVAAIESDKSLNPQGQEIDKNKILKFVLDNDLVDSKGRWNYRAAFKMMGATNVFKAKQALNDRKQIANATTSDNRAEPKTSDYATSADFSKPGNRPW